MRLSRPLQSVDDPCCIGAVPRDWAHGPIRMPSRSVQVPSHRKYGSLVDLYASRITSQNCCICCSAVFWPYVNSCAIRGLRCRFRPSQLPYVCLECCYPCSTGTYDSIDVRQVMGNQSDRIARRSFLKAAAAAAGTVSVGRSLAAEKAPERRPDSRGISLREKFFGCIAGCHIGSAMGAPVEGWPYERIEREYGMLDKLLPYSHYGKKDWVREPGTTEDGVERQKLMITAIIEKQDRINAEDLRRAWVDHMNPNAAGLVSEPFEGAAAGDGQDAHPGLRHRQVLRLLRPGLAVALLPPHRPDQRGRRPGRHRRHSRGRPALQHRQQPGHPLGGGHGHRHCRRHEARRDGR